MDTRHREFCSIRVSRDGASVTKRDSFLGRRLLSMGVERVDGAMYVCQNGALYADDRQSARACLPDVSIYAGVRAERDGNHRQRGFI